MLAFYLNKFLNLVDFNKEKKKKEMEVSTLLKVLDRLVRLKDDLAEMTEIKIAFKMDVEIQLPLNLSLDKKFFEKAIQRIKQ